MLLAICGDFAGTRALRVASLLWDRVPAAFPEFAQALVDGQAPRAACLDLCHVLADVPGAWVVYKEAEACARGWDVSREQRDMLKMT